MGFFLFWNFDSSANVIETPAKKNNKMKNGL